MKKLFIFFALLTLFSSAQAQERCRWIKTETEIPWQYPGFSSSTVAYPLQFSVTECSCFCKLFIVATGTFKYSGPDAQVSRILIMKLPQELIPSEKYYEVCRVKRANFSVGTEAGIEILPNGEVYLTMFTFIIETGYEFSFSISYLGFKH